MNNPVWNVLISDSPVSSEDIYKKLAEKRNLLDETENLPPLDFIERDQNFSNIVKKNVVPAALLIKQAIQNDEPIIIHGDYDVDGQTAVSILWRTIHNDLNHKNVFPYVPNRFDEGYGLSRESLAGIQKLLSEKNLPVKNTLLITVDCGIVSHREVLEAKELGYKVIITDHHHASENLPDSHELVWTDKATGAGIAWLISQELLKNEGLDEYKYLDLAALGTICDLQPLKGFNRSVAKYGLEKMNKSPISGIKALKLIENLSGDLDTFHLGWIIGPKLNASGRLENAMDSVRILCSDSPEQTAEIAAKLTEINRQRQDKTKIDLEYAIGLLGTEIPKFIVSHSSSYHEGVIGLVAGRLVQTYYRPSLAIAVEKETGMAKGSARSIKGISIIETLKKFENLFEKLGGHEMAAGFSLKAERIEELDNALNSQSDLDDSLFTPVIEIDMEIPSELINLDTYDLINKLRPFGAGNPEPIFMTKNLTIFNTSCFGKENQHNKLFLLGENGKKITGLMFNANSNDLPATGSKIDVVYSLTLNEWKGNKNIELRIKDILH